MKKKQYVYLALGAPLLVGGALSVACSDAAAQLDGLAEQCGLKCEAGSLVKGNASISGIRSLDAFFQSVVDFNAKAEVVSSNIELQMARIRGTLGVQSNAEIKAALDAQISANVEGSFRLVAEPPRCEVSAKATVEAAAQCDAEVKPGMVTASCKGECTLDASASASCEGNAELRCSGTAPALNCTGTCNASCEGKCELDGTVACNGTCMGTPMGGNCMGECKLNEGATCGGTCTGQCKGSCDYKPAMGSCEAGAEVKCQAMANAEVSCSGKCEGSVEPPSVKAECEASVKAKAEMNAECTPPRVDIAFKAKAGVDAMAVAQFQAKLNVIADAYGEILAEVKRANIVVKAGGDLTAAANAAVKDVASSLAASGDLKLSIGAACAVGELGSVATLLGQGTTKLQGSLTAAAMVTTAIGG